MSIIQQLNEYQGLIGVLWVLVGFVSLFMISGVKNTIRQGRNGVVQSAQSKGVNQNSQGNITN